MNYKPFKQIYISNREESRANPGQSLENSKQRKLLTRHYHDNRPEKNLNSFLPDGVCFANKIDDVSQDLL
jgi:hypothetical protein